MKKFMAVILAVTLMFGVLCIGAGAEASITETIDAIDYVLYDYLFYAELCDGYFAENGSPSANAIDQYLKLMVPFMGEEEDQYVVEMDEYGFGKYHVPADVYEAFAIAAFGNEEAVTATLRAADFYKTDYYEIEVGGGFGDYLPTIVTQGYTENDDGTITAYAYLVDTIDTDTLTDVPAEGEVEGEDYIYVCTYIYEYDEETDTYTECVKYVPAKISAGLRSVMALDVEEWVATYYSYEKIDKSSVPAAEDMTTSENKKDIAYIGGAFMEIDRNTFDDGTAIYGNEYWDDEDDDSDVFDTTAEILKDHGELAGVYDFTAVKDGETVQPKDKIPVSFMLPYDFSPDCTVVYIAEDGTVTEIETVAVPDSKDPTVLYATAELEHFSRYAVAGIRHGDADENGKVNLSDVSTMLKSIAKWEVEMNTAATDANRDGKVNLSDVSLVLKYIAKWDVVFGADYKPAEPTPEPEPEPEPEPNPEIPEVPGMEISEDGVLVKYTGTDAEVVIPDGVTAIGDHAFADREDIVSVTLPSGLKSIESHAFADCANLEDITIPDGVESIGTFAFVRCNKITELTVPDSVTNIGTGAFQQCALLSEVKLPAGLTSIESYLFYGSKSLERAVVPSGVKTIGDYAFMACKNLSDVSLSDGLESIGIQAFYDCDSLIEIDIPDSVTNIDKCTFMDCSNLETVKLPASLKAVEHGLFGLCDNLKSIVVPDGVTSIEAWTFKYCKKLEKVMIPESVTSIADGAFDGSPNVVIWCLEGSFADEYSLKNKITSHPYSE